MKIGDLIKQKDPNDKFNLKRFHDAQSFVYDEILMEVHAGKKQTNWMVFMFPQLAGLGSSDSSLEFSISSKEEARAFVKDEELWENYLEVLSVLLMRHKGVIPQLIFGKNDAMKLKSSLTLFNFIAPKEKIIKDVLKFFYADQTDKKTLSILKQMNK
ncbi:DUF1810 domain-containing protein [Empedobacter stercoris]|uniref:DUF1810 domain-containing protein n=1 Tax=Empedobacter TaxID=59734 RepID=UPI001E1A4156|nr:MULTISPECIES: DUF1810 domain-containing protein [Empedobacter]MDM1523906.1 DUF1810 family protein [Empedobacter sp. 225-1]MDM1544252.1 DUF1810 family protein [Empedobacter sp. 189-2]UWX67585.1 DUF1810 domain-containing protein [Empedobacter stercoris]HJD85832.1 DUF1810 domain-containing protein [Empedobacter falsenii]